MRVGEALKFFASLHPNPRPLGEPADEWQLRHLLRRPFDVLNRGHVVAHGPPAAVAAAQHETTTVPFTDSELDVNGLRSVPGMRRVDRRGPQVRVVGVGPILAHVGAYEPLDGLTSMELRLLLREPMIAVSLIGFALATVLVLAGVRPNTRSRFRRRPPRRSLRRRLHRCRPRRTRPAHVAGAHRQQSRARCGPPIACRRGRRPVDRDQPDPARCRSRNRLGSGGGHRWRGGLRACRTRKPVGRARMVRSGSRMFVAIGTALGGILKSGRAANALGNLIFVPAFLLGGGGPTRAVMTGVMHSISDVLLLSHVIGGIRQSWFGTTDDPNTLWWPLIVESGGSRRPLQARTKRTLIDRTRSCDPHETKGVGTSHDLCDRSRWHRQTVHGQGR